MKLLLMPKEPTWWVWLVTALLLACGLAWHPAGFVAAIALSAAQSAWFAWKLRDLWAYPVQIRVAYTGLLLLCLTPLLRWLYWLPTVGTAALLLFGYCLMARMLSLMPWNRVANLSPTLLRQTFFTPPIPGNARHGLPASGCADHFAR
jgi:hypothetical protein